MSAATTTPSEVAGLISSHSFTGRDETALQEALVEMLRSHSLECEREVRLSAADRIDILAGSIGVEVKVKGSRSEVARQLSRYAQSERIGAIVLVTTRSQHRSLQGSIGGKSVFVAHVGGGF